MDGQESAGKRAQQQFVAGELPQFAAITDDGEGGNRHHGEAQPHCGYNDRGSFALRETDKNRGRGYRQDCDHNGEGKNEGGHACRSRLRAPKQQPGETKDQAGKYHHLSLKHHLP